MKKLELTELKEHNVCVFKDMESGAKIELMLEFFKINKPQLKDKILIEDSLLDVNSIYFVQPYSFELSSEFEPRQVRDRNMKEFIVLNRSNKNYVLKRIYG